MWFSGLEETNWKPFESFSFFLKRTVGGLSGAMVDRGQQMGAAALPLALTIKVGFAVVTAIFSRVPSRSSFFLDHQLVHPR